MKKNKHHSFYPLTLLMFLCVIIFWSITISRGYELKLDGTLVKREEASGKPEDEHVKKEPEQNPSSNNDSDQESSVQNETPPVEDPSPEEIPAAETKKEFIQAEHDYLDGALFIGDSRTAVLYEYANWTKTHFFVEYGLSVWDVMDKKLATDPETGAKITVREALLAEQYEKIYIMLGINELGRGTADSFYEQYASVVDEIRTLQPNAVIFVQSIMHVTAEKDAKGTYINNQEINARNEKLKTLADDIHIFWLDENEVFDIPETQTLNPDYSWDGVHLQAKYIPLWEEFLLSHAIEITPLAITPEA